MLTTRRKKVLGSSQTVKATTKVTKAAVNCRNIDRYLTDPQIAFPTSPASKMADPRGSLSISPDLRISLTSPTAPAISDSRSDTPTLPGPSSQPLTFLVDSDLRALLQAVDFEGASVKIMPDLSRATLHRQGLLRPALDIALGATYRWGFPLSVTFRRGKKSFILRTPGDLPAFFIFMDAEPIQIPDWLQPIPQPMDCSGTLKELLASAEGVSSLGHRKPSSGPSMA